MVRPEVLNDCKKEKQPKIMMSTMLISVTGEWFESSDHLFDRGVVVGITRCAIALWDCSTEVFVAVGRHSPPEVAP